MREGIETIGQVQDNMTKKADILKELNRNSRIKKVIEMKNSSNGLNSGCLQLKREINWKIHLK